MTNTTVHSLSDFVENYQEHLTRLKETGTPEVLTVNGSAVVVVQDAASYQELLDHLHEKDAVDSLRSLMRQAADSPSFREEVNEAETQRSQAVVRELMAETERLGLYR